MIPPAIGIPLACLLALGVATDPLVFYAIPLVLFGLPHVLTELRYVDRRFSSRVPSTLKRGLVFLLGLLVLNRVLALLEFLPQSAQPVIELSILGLLILSVLPFCARRFEAILGALLIFVLIVFAPLLGMVLLALLHNLTPVGFLAERLRGAERRRALSLCALVFFVVPTLIFAAVVSGSTRESSTILGSTFESWLGPVAGHLGVFVPLALHDLPIGLGLFAAAAWLQIAHYAVVLYVLPKLEPAWSEGERVGTIDWPSPRAMAVGIVLLATVLGAGFLRNFRDARAVYGVFAAVHAWIEVPILIFAACASTAKVSAEARESCTNFDVRTPSRVH